MNTPLKGPVVLAAGGTGGHLFPAEALANELGRRGIAVELATDTRAAAYAGEFPARAVHALPSDTVRGRDPISLAKTGFRLVSGMMQAWMLFRRIRPAIVVGFGGYPTLPPLFAASQLGVPTLIHEQNGVMGRANRALAKRVSAIATGFPAVCDGDAALKAKATFTGNPLRPAVVAAAATPYDAPQADGELRLLVFGGSQGARVFADLVPPAIALLDPALRARLKIIQQAREEDMARVREAYAAIGVTAELAPFFKDLPARMAWAHMVLSRSGAGTVAELSALGRPGLLVPLPHALDQDQAANARVLANAGGALLLPQKDLTPESLAGQLSRLAMTPDQLTRMAEAAKSLGILDAAARLADLVVATARR